MEDQLAFPGDTANATAPPNREIAVVGSPSAPPDGKIPVTQEFFIPVSGQVRLYDRELSLVNHPAFARLQDIYQLGQTFYVFRGASHKRWEHALGTLQAAELIGSALRRNHDESIAKGRSGELGQFSLGEPLSSAEFAFVRLAALLHDIGHVAAGHTFEDELGLLEKHDCDLRLIAVLDRKKWRSVETESLRSLIDSKYQSFCEEAGVEITPTELFLRLVSKDELADKSKWPPFRNKSLGSFRLEVCRDIVGNTICADLLDYLHRDWWHLGKPKDFDTRLLDYFEIREPTSTLRAADPSIGPEPHLVINLRGKSEIRNDGVSAIFDLLESRYLLGEVALFHRKKLTASAMLERLIAELNDTIGGPDWFQQQVEHIFECSDEELLQYLTTLAQNHLDSPAPTGKELSETQKSRLKACIQLAADLRYRRLYKRVLAFRSHQLSHSLHFVRSKYGGAEGKQQRLDTCRALESDFQLPTGSVVIYCPRRPPHTKLAGVKVMVDSRLEKVADLDANSLDPIHSGGLFSAQLRRFEGLWRVQVAVSQEAYDQLVEFETLHTFEYVVESIVLDGNRGTGTPQELAKEAAQRLVNNRIFNPDDAYELLSNSAIAARGSELIYYANNSPTLSSLMRKRTPQS